MRRVAPKVSLASSAHSDVKSEPLRGNGLEILKQELGQMTGFEPAHTGTTIQGLNRLATPATISRFLIITQARKSSLIR